MPGDTQRNAQPLGESQSTKPTAMAACGVANKAGTQASHWANF